MEERGDNVTIYSNENALKNIKAKFKKSKNKDYHLVLKWLDYQEAQGRKHLTLTKNAFLMRKNLELLGNKPVLKLKRSDVEDYALKVTRAYVVGPYRRALFYSLKQFLTWAKKTDEPPDEVRWLRAKKPKNSLTAKDMLTIDEINLIIQSETSIVFRGLWAFLASSGCRIGEALNVRVKDVDDKKQYLLVGVTGKTGSRQVPLTDWLEPIRALLKEAKNQDDFLFYRKRSGTREQMNYSSVLVHLRSVLKRAGITKRVFPHLFRHSASTRLAEHMPQPILEKRQGWVHGSDMTAVYVHLGESEEVINAQLKYFKELYGDQQSTEEIEREAIELIWDDELGKKMLERALKDKERGPKLLALLKKGRKRL